MLHCQQADMHQLEANAQQHGAVLSPEGPPGEVLPAEVLSGHAMHVYLPHPPCNGRQQRLASHEATHPTDEHRDDLTVWKVGWQRCCDAGNLFLANPVGELRGHSSAEVAEVWGPAVAVHCCSQLAACQC